MSSNNKTISQIENFSFRFAPKVGHSERMRRLSGKIWKHFHEISKKWNFQDIENILSSSKF